MNCWNCKAKVEAPEGGTTKCPECPAEYTWVRQDSGTYTPRMTPESFARVKDCLIGECIDAAFEAVKGIVGGDWRALEHSLQKAAQTLKSK